MWGGGGGAGCSLAFAAGENAAMQKMRLDWVICIPLLYSMEPYLERPAKTPWVGGRELFGLWWYVGEGAF